MLLLLVKIAQKMWPDLPRHSLDVVSNYLNFEFKHHDAYDDARACANIMVKSCCQVNPYELASSLNIKVGKIFLNGYKACSSSRK